MATFRRTPRGNTLLLLSAVLVSLGIVGALASQAFLLYAGVALFLFYYASKLILQLKVKALDRLEITRRFPPRIGEGSLLEVEVRFVNRTFVRLPLELQDAYPPFFRIKSGTNAAVINVPARGFTELRYKVKPTSIGSNAFGPLRLVTRDLAGLFFYERSVADDVPAAVEVTPEAKALDKGVLTAVAISTYGGSLTSRTKGEGLEFADIRRYEPGDPYKRIEWHATAKTNRLMVRELNAETQLNVMVLLDSTESMAYGEAGRTKLDYAARAVASLVSYLSKRGDFVGLAVMQGDKPADIIPLARGELQAYKLLGALGRLAPKESPPDSLRSAVSRCLAVGGVKGKTLFFVITDLDFERDLQPLRQLLEINHEVIVISPYTPLFESHGLEGLDRTIYAIRTSHELKTRKRLLNQALALGIPVLDVGPDDLFQKLVVQVEELRRKGGS
ncbi:MAG: DUF58 domain-containing protein [Nitrososphaerales archaeon]